ncbi:hypothetical protein [Bernardetia sp.]|uniref:hypothetical protein n=1 Tax=Bernardetia sp. TaxID=1937974 RepID=UPI0025B9EBC0|nr:hypothetical protein [Bernardetia sp.]
MLISKKTNSISSFYSNFVKTLFILVIFSIFFSSCKDDDDVLTPEQREEQRIENEKQTLQGNWAFTSSTITTSLTIPDSTDYRNIKSTLGTVGVINNSHLELNSDDTYIFTNQIVGQASSYTLTGKWDLSKNDKTNSDFLLLENFYQQLFEQLEVDTDFLDDNFAENFNNFRIMTKTDNTITLTNNATLTEQEGVDAQPIEILAEGNYTIERQ